MTYSRSTIRIVVMAIALLLLTSFSWLFGDEAGQGLVAGDQDGMSVLVTRVIDGDTFEIETGDKVRLIGIDAPEVRGDECFQTQSTQALTALIEGKSVRLVQDVNITDRYGRLLRYAYIGESSINQWLVSEGYASAATFPPDVAMQETLAYLESMAREEGKGLWGQCQD